MKYLVACGIALLLSLGAYALCIALDRASIDLGIAEPLARFNPILPLPLADTGALEEALADIERAVEALSKMQGSAKDARDVQSLYPTGFLRALRGAEESRRAFLESPSARSYLAYEERLRRALSRGRRDAERLSQVLDSRIGEKEFRILLLGGDVTDESMRSASAGLIKRFRALEEAARNRSECVRGKGACPSLSSLADLPHAYGEEERAKEVIRTLSEAYRTEAPSSYIVVSLPESACLGNIQAPYHFALADSGGSIPVRLKYLDDLFFLRTDAPGARTLQHMAAEHAVEFSRFEPTAYYNCPDALTDLGRVVAATETARALGAAPGDFRDYAALAGEAEARAKEEGFADISLAFRSGTAGIDILAREIADVLSIDIRFRETGVPFNLDAQTLFLTQTAFTSLFLAHDASVSPASPSAVERGANTPRPERGKLERYSEMKERMPREDILHNIRSTAAFEGTLTP